MRIVEIFDSWMGEGKQLGQTAMFIRFAGCNKQCPHCDTKYSWIKGLEIGLLELLRLVKENTSEYVVITGGEPLLQKEEIMKLVSHLKLLNRKVILETNGTIELRRDETLLFDTIYVSPKEFKISDWLDYSNVVLKIVASSEAEVSDWMTIIDKYSRSQVMFMPKGYSKRELLKSFKAINNICATNKFAISFRDQRMWGFT